MGMLSYSISYIPLTLFIISFLVVDLHQPEWNESFILEYFDYHLNIDAKKPYPLLDHQKFVRNTTYFTHVFDEQNMLKDILKSQHYIHAECTSKQDVIDFFKANKKAFYKGCENTKPIMHCQRAYVFQYESSIQSCHGYKRERYIREDYTGVTQTLHLSLARMDRLSFHLSRWHDNMSIALQLFEHELPQALDYVMKYARNNIRWSFYIIDDAPTNKCFYIRKNGTRLFHDSCYECNILRNLAIESITTSHFLIIDGDGIMTPTLNDNIKKFENYLRKDTNVILIPLYLYQSSDTLYCKKTGDCDHTYQTIPNTKEELKNYKLSFKSGHHVTNTTLWMTYWNNTLIPWHGWYCMEPYSIIKRTRQLPLFSPIFYNYGRNKEDFFRRLSFLNYTFSTLSLDFAIDLPHPPSVFEGEFQKNRKKRKHLESIEYTEGFYQLYCKTHTCVTMTKEDKNEVKKKKTTKKSV